MIILNQWWYWFMYTGTQMCYYFMHACAYVVLYLNMYRYIPLRVCTLVLPVILSSLNSATNIVHIHVCLDNNFEYFLAFWYYLIALADEDLDPLIGSALQRYTLSRSLVCNVGFYCMCYCSGIYIYLYVCIYTVHNLLFWIL